MDHYGTNFRAPKVDVHDFAMIPRADIPRSSFTMPHQHKTTINASQLTPIYLQEVLPGDSFNVKMTAFCRLATPIVPIMDNITLEAFFFFVPCRLIWTNWYKFQGEQDTPGDSISFTIPQVVSPVAGFARLSIYDYFGLPCTGQTAAGNTITVNALPFRAYGLIYNQWFRDENQVAPSVFGSTSTVGYAAMDNGPDPSTNYALRTVAKKHDYFTSALPWTQKATTAITLPLGTTATVKTNATELYTAASTAIKVRNITGANLLQGVVATDGNAPAGLETVTNPTGTFAGGIGFFPTNLYADLSTATAATVNQLRLAFQTQRLLERDARGGTRYTEIIRSHFGVISPDMRLQRPEYLGGGKTPITISPVPQTTATGLTGGSTPIGTLSAAGTAISNNGFNQSFTEHGYILGLVTARCEPMYQQGIRKLWLRNTRYDFYMPVFQALGEQAITNAEIYSDGSANDALTFGYQERWAEYRYHPSFTTGYFNSTNSTPLDVWHTAQKYTALPALNSTFMLDPTATTLQRNLAAGAASANQQLLCDFFFQERVARPMPMYSVPGMIDHF